MRLPRFATETTEDLSRRSAFEHAQFLQATADGMRPLAFVVTVTFAQATDCTHVKRTGRAQLPRQNQLAGCYSLLSCFYRPVPDSSNNNNNNNTYESLETLSPLTLL